MASTKLPVNRKPDVRPLRAYAFDPSQGRALGNEMSIAVRNHPLEPGPVMIPQGEHDGLAVVDYDATRDVYYAPVNLDDPYLLMQGGLAPSESNPHFHQQMVYAVARETIEHFEVALGRRIHWRRAERAPGDPPGWRKDDIVVLHLFPHAMRAANAFYCPDAHGILFGYFSADRDDPGRNIPGQAVFTCLSHDIVVHETTHAIVDGMRGYFLEQSNVDVPAFHEAFADLAALFRHYSHEEVLLDTLQRTGGRLYAYQLRPDATTDTLDAPVRNGKTPSSSATTSGTGAGAPQPLFSGQVSAPNPLVELAQQFGEASGLRRGLRSALGTPPNPDPLKHETEPHARGSILVAAVFDAFFTTYVKRTSDLFRIFRAGGGSADPVDLPMPLAHQLARVASDTAEEFFERCVRAIDYCPPVDITFGDFLRALVTADMDSGSADPEGIRDTFMQAFRMRGILPDTARFFSEGALCWPTGEALGLPDIKDVPVGDANAFTRVHLNEAVAALQKYTDDSEVRRILGLEPGRDVSVPSFHPVFRQQDDGTIRSDMVAEVVQTRSVPLEAPDDGKARASHAPTFPFRSGATLILTHARDPNDRGRTFVRYAICKPGSGPEGARRLERQRSYAERSGLAQAPGKNGLRVNFGLVHGGF